MVQLLPSCFFASWPTLGEKLGAQLAFVLEPKYLQCQDASASFPQSRLSLGPALGLGSSQAQDLLRTQLQNCGCRWKEVTVTQSECGWALQLVSASRVTRKASSVNEQIILKGELAVNVLMKTF